MHFQNCLLVSWKWMYIGYIAYQLSGMPLPGGHLQWHFCRQAKYIHHATSCHDSKLVLTVLNWQLTIVAGIVHMPGTTAGNITLSSRSNGSTLCYTKGSCYIKMPSSWLSLQEIWTASQQVITLLYQLTELPVGSQPARMNTIYLLAC